MRSFRILVVAQYDPEAQVWVATSEDIQGLALEADDLDTLARKILVAVPELVEANGFARAWPIRLAQRLWTRCSAAHREVELDIRQHAVLAACA